MSFHRLVTALLALALVVPASGCGKQQTTSGRIREDTAAVVRALNAKDATAARHALDVLEQDVAAAGRLGQLDGGTVSALQSGVTKLRADLALITPQVVTPTVSPATTPPRPYGKKKHGHDNGDNGD